MLGRKTQRYTTGIRMRIIVLHLIIILNRVMSENFNMGYLTGSQRIPGNLGYRRPGLVISGAITLAVDEINKYHPLRKNSILNFTVAETYGEERESIYQIARLWTQNISVYIGPQETCVHEARMASSFNLPMISYVSKIYRYFIITIADLI